MNDLLAAGLKKAGLATAERHLFLCLGPECCPLPEGEALWEIIKRRVRETGLRAMRTKAQCLRICTGGPWLVVYPDGVWYGAMNEERFERVLREHLIGGHPVDEWVAARNTLGCGLEGGHDEARAQG